MKRKTTNLFLSLLVCLWLVDSIADANTEYNAEYKPSIFVSTIKPFATDGCTNSSDGWWKHCCVEHDVAYWMGGTSKQRDQIDSRFIQCLDNIGGPGLFYFMFVRAAAGAEAMTDYSWGFGWKTYQGYKELSADQLNLVEEELNVWRATAEYDKFYMNYVRNQGAEPLY